MSAAGIPPAPPKLPRALLHRVVPDDARDAVDGDLHELYVARRATSGSASAAAWYWLQALSFAMRFILDRTARAIRNLLTGRVAPSALDIKLGGRMLAKSPGLAVVGGLGMAVAVALGAGAYSVINSYFYPELPLADGDRVIALGKFDTQRQIEDERLLHDFVVWRRDLHSVTDLSAFRTVRRNLLPESGGAEPISIAEITASGFRVARVPALRGRTLVDDDERPGAAPVVVIGYDVWQSRFGGDPAVVGRQIRLGRTLHTIVGIMPAGFAFPVNHQYWIPLRVDSWMPVAPDAGPELDVFGRLSRDATKETAQAELTVVARRIAAEGPTELAQLQSRIVPYTDILVHAEAENESETMALMRFLIALLLVVVATNVGVLVYARTVTRTEEIAVRTALGATRGRIVGQLFAEALVLSGLSALVGLAIVAVGLSMFDRTLAEWFEGHPPFWIHPGLSTGTVLYALGLALLAAVIVGVVPAMRATGAQLRAAMGSLGSGAKARLGPTWTALIVAQVAITVALIPPAMLKGWETVRVGIQEPGFARGKYLSTQLLIERDEATNDARIDSVATDTARTIVNGLLARLATEPGVAGATITSTSPWGGSTYTLEIEGSNSQPEIARVVQADASFFGLFGIPLLTGRTFGPADAALRFNERPVIVNRSFVNELFPSGDAIGRRVRYRYYGDTQRWFTIVGVVDDFPGSVQNLGFPSSRTMYHLATHGELTKATLTIRVQNQSPEAFASTLRRITPSISPVLQLSRTRALEAVYGDDTRDAQRMAMVIVLVIGSVILLSAAGIHALMSFTVNQRRREIGIRTALGAPARRIATAILVRASRQLLIGLGIGLVASIAFDKASGGEMMGGSGLLLVPVTAAFMFIIALFAAAGPVRRGLRVHPTETLRAE